MSDFELRKKGRPPRQIDENELFSMYAHERHKHKVIYSMEREKRIKMIKDAYCLKKETDPELYAINELKISIVRNIKQYLTSPTDKRLQRLQKLYLYLEILEKEEQ